MDWLAPMGYGLPWARGGRAREAEDDDLAALERERLRANKACLVEMERHLRFFLEDYDRSPGPPPEYEEWIRAVHPENALGGVDPRFYLEKSDHRLMWNKRCAPERRVEPRSSSSAKESPSRAAAEDDGDFDAEEDAERELGKLKELKANLERLVELQRERDAGVAKEMELQRLRQEQANLQHLHQEVARQKMRTDAPNHDTHARAPRQPQGLRPLAWPPPAHSPAASPRSLVSGTSFDEDFFGDDPFSDL